MAKRAVARSKTTATATAGATRAPSARAAAIKAALEELRDRQGRITPDRVVQAAKNPKHVLHREFGWDDRKEANLRRLDRARDLIVQYVTVTVIYKNERLSAPYFVRDPTAAPLTQGYIALVGDEMNRENATAVMIAELARCESSISRARRITGILDSRFPGLSNQLEALLAKVVELRTTVERAVA
jgi:hypothetical protein